MIKTINRSIVTVLAWVIAIPFVTRLVNAQAVPAPIDLLPSSNSPFYKTAGNAKITPAEIVKLAISSILVVAALLFFFMLVLGGVKWIISGGDKGNVETARKQITNALIGLAIIFIAWAIIQLLAQVFGVNIISLPVPTLPAP